jgi:hypothetical protein
MDYMIELLKWIVIGFVISGMSEFVSELLYEFVSDKLNKLVRLLLSLVIYILSCPKCFTFWMIVILTGDVLGACVAAYVVSGLKKIEYKLVGGTKL